jgi:hypothetical protein
MTNGKTASLLVSVYNAATHKLADQPVLLICVHLVCAGVEQCCAAAAVMRGQVQPVFPSSSPASNSRLD